MRDSILFTAVILLSMLPCLTVEAQVIKTVNITTAGTLATSLNANELATVTDLTITGIIDVHDFNTMRNEMPILATIDLSTAEVVACTEMVANSSIVYPANELPWGAFHRNTRNGKSTLTNIKLPVSITSIGGIAFLNCHALTSITIPETVNKIGDFAFVNCSAFIIVEEANLYFSSAEGVLFNKAKSLLIHCPISKKGIYDIPALVTSIGTYAFADCTGLTSISIPSSVNSLGDWVFDKCTGLTSIYAHNPTPIILTENPTLFADVNKASCTLYVPIGSKAAYQETPLWKDFANIVELGVAVSKTLHLDASGKLFSTLTADELLTINNLTITGKIDDRDFKTMNEKMPVLVSLDLSAVSIRGMLPNNAFYNKSTNQGKISIVNIRLPATLTSIGESAFRNCSSLTYVEIPSLVTFIGPEAFYNCRSLTTISIPASVTTIGSCAFLGSSVLHQVENGNLNYSSIDGVLFNKEQTELIQCPASNIGIYIIPKSVTSIGNNAFEKCMNLTSVVIPTSVFSIGTNAFFNCIGLTSITIPTSVTSIGNTAFYNCKGLTSIYANAATPIDFTSAFSVFKGVDLSSCTLYVPIGSKPAYQAAVEWEDFQNIVERPTSVSNELANKPIIYGLNNTLYIKNPAVNSLVRVYDITGRIRYSGRMTNSPVSIELNKGAVYLVQINNLCYKIIL